VTRHNLCYCNGKGTHAPSPPAPLTQSVQDLALHSVANIPPLAVADSVVIASDNDLTRSHLALTGLKLKLFSLLFLAA
jgi:hypothetical protein